MWEEELVCLAKTSAAKRNCVVIIYALEYIDNHLDEPIPFEAVAKRFHFS